MNKNDGSYDSIEKHLPRHALLCTALLCNCGTLLSPLLHHPGLASLSRNRSLSLLLLSSLSILTTILLPRPIVWAQECANDESPTKLTPSDGLERCFALRGLGEAHVNAAYTFAFFAGILGGRGSVGYALFPGLG